MRIFLRDLISLCFLLSVSVTCVYAFSAADVISPVAGVWNNVQPLVLNAEDGSELYYSLTDSDPLLSGFAYDGPVVIEERGDVRIKITAVSPGGVRNDVTVAYTVKELPYTNPDEDSRAFVSMICDNPIRKYVSGTKFSIPSTCTFTMNDNESRFRKGTDLSLSARNVWERYVPFTVREKDLSFRFVMHIMAAKRDSIRKKNVPFILRDWTMLTFTNSKYSYQVDNGAWKDGMSEMVIDRFSTHVIRWKVIGSAENSAMLSYTLPPMPALKSQPSPDGSVTFTVQPAVNDYSSTPYMLGMPSDSMSVRNIASGLYARFVADTFEGDEIHDIMRAGVYYDGVYQGLLETAFILDRLPPDAPVIASSAKGALVRNQIAVSVQAEPRCDVYVAVSSPVEFEIETEEKNRALFDAVQVTSYHLHDGKDLIFASLSDSATFYKIKSYAVDASGNKSAESEFRVVVDEHNFYLRADAAVAEGIPGSYNNPFTSFEQAVEAINCMADMRLHVSGTVKVSGEHIITSDCTVIGENCRLLLEENASLSFLGAQVELYNCTIEKKSADRADRNCLIVENAALTMRNCEVIGQFRDNAVLVDAAGSFLNLENVGLTARSSVYACALSARGTETAFVQGRLTCVSQTGVNASVYGGNITLLKSMLSINAHTGRCVELVKTAATLEDNTFSSRGTSLVKKNLFPVWKDAATVIEKEGRNYTNGF